MLQFFKKGKNLLYLFLFLDILIISLHFIFRGKVAFNLDLESNLPTVYQGSKLILLACLSFLILILTFLKKRSIGKEKFWIFLGLMGFFIGVDELGQIHENISGYMKEILGISALNYELILAELGYSSAPWLPYYIGFFIIATIIVASSIKKFYQWNSKATWLLIVGWLLFLGVPVMEFVNTLPNIMFQEGYEILSVIEESFEMIGTTFVLAFTYEALLDKFFMLYYTNEISKKYSKQNK